VTGFTWFQVGQQSRAAHRTQGMGRWVPWGAEHDWPLHLARSEVGGGASVTDGLPATLADLAAFAGAPELSDDLDAAQAAVSQARTAFPDGAAVARAAVEAVRCLRRARDLCPEDARGEVVHRIDRKLTQLAHVIRIGSGVELRGHVDPVVIPRGASGTLTVDVSRGAASAVEVSPVVPPGWSVEDGTVQVAADADLSDPYPARYLPDAPEAPALRVRVTCDGVETESLVPLEAPPVVGPTAPVAVTPATVLVNRSTPGRSFDLMLDPPDADLTLPERWTSEPVADGLRVHLPDDVPPGLTVLPVASRLSQRVISAVHAGTRLRAFPAEIRVRVIDVALPAGRIGYIGGGNDAVLPSLQAAGFPATPLPNGSLTGTTPFDGYDSLVVGVFAMRTRPDLRARLTEFHDWVARGGTLLTLYHRPWDAWDPQVVPPRPLTIGKPSLRWRVTDEAAEVTHLAPDHPLLTTPNRIGPEDWAGWHKERGLYFAMDWDPTYEPLLSMADASEAPLTGALLTARIGAGRHTHCALTLHHQMTRLVPGAFRLMANLLAPAQP
ncbi:MAG: PIG-L family deacetylase, partial [Pseudomonadota bacterium]